MEVGLSPGDIVLDGDLAPPYGRGTAASHFSAHVYCDQTVTDLSNCWALVLFANASGSAFYPSYLQKKSQKLSAFYTFYNPHIRRSALYGWDMMETYKIISPTLAISDTRITRDYDLRLHKSHFKYDMHKRPLLDCCAVMLPIWQRKTWRTQWILHLAKFRYGATATKNV